MKKILVTGADGQLGKCIRSLAKKQKDLDFLFVTRQELDVTDAEMVTACFKAYEPDFCINTAAYTAVDKAESESDIAYKVNAEGAHNIASACRSHNVVLFHISTDYVFDGQADQPYSEDDQTSPLQVYGASKLKGEERIRETWEKHFIFRTSWLYSEHESNFIQFVLSKLRQGEMIKITTEQTGSPTNANDLADAIMYVISLESEAFGTYHFCNSGSSTWYGVAMAISELMNDLGAGLIEKTDYYRTFAARPKYSVLDTNKLETTFVYKIPAWKNSLKGLLDKSA